MQLTTKALNSTKDLVYGRSRCFCLLSYPRIYVRQLFLIFSRVKLEFLEAQLRPIEQLDMEVEIGC
jgi:hypothetical protein